MKTLKDISWNIDESEYREHPALSYTTLSRYEREGFNNLFHIFDKVESPSITFGSAVDALVTGGRDEFDKKFFVMKENVKLPDSLLNITKELFNVGYDKYSSLYDFPDDVIYKVIDDFKYQSNWKQENRIKKVREQCNEYYKILFDSNGKDIIDAATAEQIYNCVSTLKLHQNTSFFFNPSSDELDLERWYQLKFKTTLGDIEYKCMVDLLIVDHENKKIYPIDLKTSGHRSWDFFESFIHWHYDIQARLYWRIVRDIMDKDDEYKYYALDDFRFVVIDKDKLIPLIWKFDDTQTYGTLYYGKNDKIEMRDPLDIGQELSTYISPGMVFIEGTVPNGINRTGDNNITEWLNKH